MRFVPAVCENCDGALKYDSATKLWYCGHCGYISDKESPINYYTTNISDLHFDGIHFDMEMTVEMRMRLKAAEGSLTLGKYDDAFKRFLMLSDDIPHDYRVWWGQIRAKTRELTVDVESKAELNTLCGLYDSMMHFVPESNRDEIERRFMSYIQVQDERLDQRISALKLREDELHEEQEAVKKELKEWEQATYERGEQALKITEAVFAAALIFGIIGRSLPLFIAGLVSIGYYFLVLIPDTKRKEADWASEKRKCTDELIHRRRAIDQELKEIAAKQQKLTT